MSEAAEHFSDRLRREGTLQDYAEELRHAANGHSDPMDAQRGAELRAYLWCRLADWHEPTDEWDTLVKGMVCLALGMAQEAGIGVVQ